MRSLVKLSSILALVTATAATAAASPSSTENGPARDHRDDAQPAAREHYRRRPGPRFMLPLRIDIGAQGANTSHGYLPGIEVRAGVHWASLSPTPTNFDIGLGVFGAALIGASNDTMPGADNDVVYGGAYLEAGETLSHGDYWRTWASARGEYLASNAFGQESSGFGVAGRLSAELYTSGVGVEPRGVFLGTYAIGVYVEAAGRELGDGVSPVQISGGLTFRTPLVLAP
jgi:hypothetical protein